MKSTFFNRYQNSLVGVAAVTAIIVVTAFSIELLYQLFQFIETTIGASTRQAGEHISYGY